MAGRGYNYGVSPPDFDNLAYLEAQKIWLDGAAALAQANMLLARENCASMYQQQQSMMHETWQENARLARENKMLRKKVERAAPPGLEAVDEEEPGAESEPTASKQSFVKGRPAKHSFDSSDASTAAGSFGLSSWGLDISCPPGSWKRGSFDSSSPPGSWSLGASSQMGSWAGLAASGPPGNWAMDNSAVQEEPEVPELEPGSSVMMRHLPNDYTRSMLIELLQAEGFDDQFDFVYLPVDFRSSSGLGYAFINFLSLEIAEQVREHFAGFKQWSVASEKVCEVSWSSMQGLEVHIERFRNSPVMHESVPDEQKPAIFEGRERLPFPEPTKKIRIPRHWHRRH